MYKRAVLALFISIACTALASNVAAPWAYSGFADYNTHIVDTARTGAGPVDVFVNDANIFFVWEDTTNLFGAGTDDDIWFRHMPLSALDYNGHWSDYNAHLVSTESSGNSTNPKIVVNDENIFIVWKDATNFGDADGENDIFFKHMPLSNLDSNGGTGYTDWADYNTLMVSTESSDDGASGPDIVVNDSNIFIAWDDSSTFSGNGAGQNSYIAFKHMPLSGLDKNTNTWVDYNMHVVSTETATTFLTDPAMAVNDANIFFVWRDQTNWAGSGTDGDVMFKHMPLSNLDSNGGTGYTDWADYNTLVVSTESSGASTAPQIRVNDSNIFIVWGADDVDIFGAGTDGDIWLKYMPLTDLDKNVNKWADRNVHLVSTEDTQASKNADLNVSNDRITIVWNGDNWTGTVYPVQLKTQKIADLDFNGNWSDLNTWRVNYTVSTATNNVIGASPRIAANDANAFVAWYGYTGALVNVPMFKHVPLWNNAPDVNVLYPNGATIMLGRGDVNVTDGNLSVDFVVRDLDVRGSVARPGAIFTASIYYSATAGAKTTAIIGDLNLLADGICDDLNFAGADSNTGSTCHWDWNALGVDDGNYFIDIVVSDNNGSTYTNSSDNNFMSDFTVPTAVSISSPSAGDTSTSTSTTLVHSTSTDALSGVIKYWVRLDSGNWIDNLTATTYQFTDLTSGAHVLYAKSMDAADNNSADASVSIRVELGPGVAACGDGECDAGEDACSCATDCGALCGDGCCTGTESASTCPEDCLSACGDGLCDTAAGETCGTCSEDCGACQPVEPPPGGEIVITQTQTGIATEQQIEEVLREGGFTISEIAGAKTAAQKVAVTRRIEVVKKASPEAGTFAAAGQESYISFITLNVKNISGTALKNVRIVEKIPKSVANTADEIISARPFAVLESDPIVQFSVVEIAAGTTAEVQYSLAKELTEQQLSDFTPAIPAYAVEAAEARCELITCNDKNPCTDDLCFDGECAYIRAKDGTTCGFGKECSQGVCRGVAAIGPGIAVAGLDAFTLTVIAIVIAVAAIGIAAYLRARG